MPDYRTTTNMLRMVRRLEQTHAGALPVNRLANELQVHRRTVVRWLSALQAEWVDDDGNPILRREHRSGEAWAVLTGATTVLSANIFQYAATAAATKHLEVGGGSLLSESAADVLDRVEAAMPETLQEYVPRVRQAFHYVPFAPKDHRESEDTLDLLVRALIRRHPIELGYRNAAGEESQKRLEPWSLVMYRDGFYLLARSPSERRLRLYAVERMFAVGVDKNFSFEIPADYDPADEFGRNLGLWRTDSEPVRVLVAFEPECAAPLRARRWPGFRQLTETDDGRLLLELEVPVTPEIKSWVLSWGSVAEVLQPDSLRAIVADEAAAAAARYG